MTLKELSAQYEAAAQPLRDRLRELRLLLKQTNDPDKKWHIERRIADLQPMLTQMNDLVWLLEHYYERGGSDRDDRYGFCGKSKSKSVKREADENLTPDLRKRINRLTKANLRGLLPQEEKHYPNCTRAGGSQKHRKSNAGPGREESTPDHEVPLSCNEALLNSLFGPDI